MTPRKSPMRYEPRSSNMGVMPKSSRLSEGRSNLHHKTTNQSPRMEQPRHQNGDKTKAQQTIFSFSGEDGDNQKAPKQVDGNAPLSSSQAKSSSELERISKSTEDDSKSASAKTNSGRQDLVGQELIDWLEINGAETKKLQLRQYAPEVRGVHSRRMLVPGERILTIPLKCLITVEMGQATDIGQKLLAHNIEFVAPKHIFLMMFLLTDMEHMEQSFFKSYYSTLPSTLSNMPVFWTEEEMQWLQGSYIVHQIHERKAAIRNDYETICRVDPDFARFSLEQFSWARMIVCSRNFGLTIEGVKTAALVPFADMLNHFRPRETSWTYDDSLGAFTITSLESISLGSQVYDSYGKKCNHRFLLNYGFAVEDNTEEDGSNPNEVMVFLSLFMEEGQLFFDKKAFLEENGIFSLETRMSCGHSDPNTREAFSFARLIVATEVEFSRIKRLTAFAHQLPPISFDNEIRVLQYLRSLMVFQLEQYERSLEEDNELIQSHRFEAFSNEMHALYFIRGEKQVCLHIIQLADKVIPLLSLPRRECQQELEQHFDGDDDVCRYVQDVLAYLFSQED